MLCRFYFAIALVVISISSGCGGGSGQPEMMVADNKQPTNNTSTLDKATESALAKLEKTTSASSAGPKTGTACLSPKERQAWLKPPGDDSPALEKPLNDFLSEATSIITGPASVITGAFDQAAANMDPKSVKPICGNWCGAHRILTGGNPAAMDELDEACKRHDLCYRQAGKQNCGCDQQLLFDVLRGRPSIKLTENEQKIFLYYQGSPCQGGCKRANGIQVCGRAKFG